MKDCYLEFRELAKKYNCVIVTATQPKDPRPWRRRRVRLGPPSNNPDMIFIDYIDTVR